MANESRAYHYHKWTVPMEVYKNSPSFQKLAKVISTNTNNNDQFLTSFEGYDYPFFGIMYHPEFAFIEIKSENHQILAITDEINKDIAQKISSFFVSKCAAGLRERISSHVVAQNGAVS